jgi:hypothetical protein
VVCSSGGENPVVGRNVSLVALSLAALSVLHPQQRTPAVDAFAQVQALNAELLSSGSATKTLANWCGMHHLADEPRIVAHRVTSADRPLTAEQRRRLDIADHEAVKYRRVELVCGSHVLSVADNWYVPGRLEPEMNRLLDTTDTPFGMAVAPLKPTRETFLVRVLWNDSSRPMPDAILEHLAVLSHEGSPAVLRGRRAVSACAARGPLTPECLKVPEVPKVPEVLSA